MFKFGSGTKSNEWIAQFPKTKFGMNILIM